LNKETEESAISKAVAGQRMAKVNWDELLSMLPWELSARISHSVIITRSNEFLVSKTWYSIVWAKIHSSWMLNMSYV
jgi:hypothetical protein